MSAATLSGKSVAPAVVRTAPAPCNGSRSFARGLDDLRWIGLVAGVPPANHDELAFQSLSTDQCGDDPASWIA